MEKKWIFADVDGTISESCQPMAAEMATEINRLLANGYNFVFISGTKKSLLLDMISPHLDHKHFVLPTTGTKCIEVHNEKQEEIYSHGLSGEEKEEIMDALNTLVAKFNMISMTTKEDQIQNRESQVTLSVIGRGAPKNLKDAHDPSGERRQVWANYLKTLLDPTKYEMTVAGSTSIDVTKKGIDKAWGITQFSKIYNVELDSILFFGDRTQPGGNDYPATTIVDSVTVTCPQDTLKHLRKLG
ncbi:TPA: HAD-IIB family hydrolase [Candidatus Woesearchaeota archaeon]|nr:hypothetical protein [archaeon]HIJ12044.1 HAD-IIB family hydrolase [Candidatus Woesearchaeota archaeon]|tara:strand:+ start:360 stop:1088 length:729 start_codon:yes stop_codon:yes gene_type:complete